MSNNFYSAANDNLRIKDEAYLDKLKAKLMVGIPNLPKGAEQLLGQNLANFSNSKVALISPMHHESHLSITERIVDNTTPDKFTYKPTLIPSLPVKSQLIQLFQTEVKPKIENSLHRKFKGIRRDQKVIELGAQEKEKSPPKIINQPTPHKRKYHKTQSIWDNEAIPQLDDDAEQKSSCDSNHAVKKSHLKNEALTTVQSSKKLQKGQEDIRSMPKRASQESNPDIKMQTKSLDNDSPEKWHKFKAIDKSLNDKTSKTKPMMRDSTSKEKQIKTKPIRSSSDVKSAKIKYPKQKNSAKILAENDQDSQHQQSNNQVKLEMSCVDEINEKPNIQNPQVFEMSEDQQALNKLITTQQLSQSQEVLNTEVWASQVASLDMDPDERIIVESSSVVEHSSSVKYFNDIESIQQEVMLKQNSINTLKTHKSMESEPRQPFDPKKIDQKENQIKHQSDPNKSIDLKDASRKQQQKSIKTIQKFEQEIKSESAELSQQIKIKVSDLHSVESKYNEKISQAKKLQTGTKIKSKEIEIVKSQVARNQQDKKQESEKRIKKGSNETQNKDISIKINKKKKIVSNSFQDKQETGEIQICQNENILQDNQQSKSEVSVIEQHYSGAVVVASNQELANLNQKRKSFDNLDIITNENTTSPIVILTTKDQNFNCPALHNDESETIKYQIQSSYIIKEEFNSIKDNSGKIQESFEAQQNKNDCTFERVEAVNNSKNKKELKITQLADKKEPVTILFPIQQPASHQDDVIVQTKVKNELIEIAVPIIQPVSFQDGVSDQNEALKLDAEIVVPMKQPASPPDDVIQQTTVKKQENVETSNLIEQPVKLSDSSIVEMTEKKEVAVVIQTDEKKELEFKYFQIQSPSEDLKKAINQIAGNKDPIDRNNTKLELEILPNAEKADRVSFQNQNIQHPQPASKETLIFQNYHQEFQILSKPIQKVDLLEEFKIKQKSDHEEKDQISNVMLRDEILSDSKIQQTIQLLDLDKSVDQKQRADVIQVAEIVDIDSNLKQNMITEFYMIEQVKNEKVTEMQEQNIQSSVLQQSIEEIAEQVQSQKLNESNNNLIEDQPKLQPLIQTEPVLTTAAQHSQFSLQNETESIALNNMQIDENLNLKLQLKPINTQSSTQNLQYLNQKEKLKDIQQIQQQLVESLKNKNSFEQNELSQVKDPHKSQQMELETVQDVLRESRDQDSPHFPSELTFKNLDKPSLMVSHSNQIDSDQNSDQEVAQYIFKVQQSVKLNGLSLKNTSALARDANQSSLLDVPLDITTIQRDSLQSSAQQNQLNKIIQNHLGDEYDGITFAPNSEFQFSGNGMRQQQQADESLIDQPIHQTSHVNIQALILLKKQHIQISKQFQEVKQPIQCSNYLIKETVETVKNSNKINTTDQQKMKNQAVQKPIYLQKMELIQQNQLLSSGVIPFNILTPGANLNQNYQHQSQLQSDHSRNYSQNANSLLQMYQAQNPSLDIYLNTPLSQQLQKNPYPSQRDVVQDKYPIILTPKYINQKVLANEQIQFSVLQRSTLNQTKKSVSDQKDSTKTQKLLQQSQLTIKNEPSLQKLKDQISLPPIALQSDQLMGREIFTPSKTFQARKLSVQQQNNLPGIHLSPLQNLGKQREWFASGILKKQFDKNENR